MVIQIFLNAPCKPMVIVYNIQKNAQKTAKKDKMNRNAAKRKERHFDANSLKMDEDTTSSCEIQK